jgi:hypothetical protein
MVIALTSRAETARLGFGAGRDHGTEKPSFSPAFALARSL